MPGPGAAWQARMTCRSRNNRNPMGLKTHPLIIMASAAVMAAGLLSGCGNQYRAPPPQPPPNLTVLYGVDPEYKALYTLHSGLGVHNLVGLPGPGRLEAPAAMAIRPSDGEVFVYNNDTDPGVRRYWGLLRLDRCSGFARRIGPEALPRIEMAALAFAPGGRLYGFGQADPAATGSHMLYTIDPLSGDYLAIARVFGRTDYSVAAADFHPDGDLYGIGSLDGEGIDRLQFLLIIDTQSGQPRIVGELDAGIRQVNSIAFKPSGKLLGAGVNATGERVLFEIDIASAEISTVRRTTVTALGIGFAPPRSC